MNKKNPLHFALPAVIAISILAGAAARLATATAIGQEERYHENFQLLMTLIETIQRNYVEERSLNDLLESAINGVLSTLDPHTVYLPADNYRRWNLGFEGMSGIGIYFEIIGRYPVITGFVENSPAQKSELEVGDIIVKINNRSTLGLTKEEVIDLISGHAYTKVLLSVFDREQSKAKTVAVERTHLDMKSITGAYLLAPNVGYIALERFNSTTASELDEALDMLLARGMAYLILDMRDNGGGYLSAAVEVTDRFLSPGKLITYTKGRHGHSFQEYYSRLSSRYESLPVLILINHGTASAAEIVAGALQDWDRALIVGTRSFGKGLVQSQFRFRDGSALLVTTARYYTPLGRLIQRDYSNLSKDEYYAGAYVNENTLALATTHRQEDTFKTPLGRTVYGGGGIKPDIIVENEQAEISDLLRLLYIDENNYFLKFATRLLIENPSLKTLGPEKCAKLEISTGQLRQFYETVRTGGFSMSREQFEANLNDISFLLKRDLSYLIAGNEGRFHVNMQRDTQLLVAYTRREKARRLLLGDPVVRAREEVEKTVK